MYDSVVFSAGGTYGSAYVGAYKALEARNLTFKLKRFHGTSSGAIVATMAACGLTSAEMHRVLETACVEPRPKISLRRLSADWGAVNISEYMKTALDSFLPDGATFVTLAKKYGVFLSVHAYDIGSRKLVDFNLETTPDMEVRVCVEASCCVPLVFRPVTINGTLHVDGAVSQRTPMHAIIDPKRTLVLDVMDEISGHPTDIIQYITALTAGASRYTGKYEGDFLTISVPEGSPGITDLPMSKDKLTPMVEAGYVAVRRLLNDKCGESV